MKPRLLDLFCGAGGAAMGYARAGFEVVGVDIAPQPRYPFEFHQADALEVLTLLGKRHVWSHFDAIHASPPCQRYSLAQNAAKNAEAHPDLVPATRRLLEATGKPWVMENVVGAPMPDSFIVCGLSLGLNVKRHRQFESSHLILIPPCPPGHPGDWFVIFGHEVRSRRHGHAAGRKNRIAAGREAMGIDWMSRGELSEAVPPAYTEHIGRQLMQALMGAA